MILKKNLAYTTFNKSTENVQKQRDIQLLTRDKRRNYSVFEPYYQSEKLLPQKLVAIKMEKTKVKMT